MKLTGILKDRVDAAATKEEKKAIIAGAGMELNDDELEHVAGGSGATRFDPPVTKQKPTGSKGNSGGQESEQP